MSSKSEEKCDLPKILGTTGIKDENEDERSMLDVTEMEKSEPESIQSPSSNINEVFDKDETMKSIVFPYMIQSDDKVEILPSTNVWIFKNDFYTIKAMCQNICSSNRHSKMINFLLTRLIGEENLPYVSLKNWTKFIALPETILFVVETFTRGNCLPKCTYSPRQMTRFMQGVFKDSRRNIEDIQCKKNGGEIKEEEEILILYDKINEEKTLELYKTYDKITFPYMIPTEEKIELVRGYNVWITRTELETINRKCMNLSCFLKHRTIVRLLFKDLLGTENMRFMSIGGSKVREETRKYIELPEEIYSAVLSYSGKQCDSLNCGHALFKNHGYHDYVTYILSKARQGISRKNKYKQNEIQRKAENQDILFPYMIQSENKVELVLGSNVWILKNDLCKIKEKCEGMPCGSKHKQIIHYLFNILLSTENLKYLSVCGSQPRRNNYLKLPEELKNAVLVYATQTCEASDCDARSSNYIYFMGSIFSNARAFDERRNSSGSEYNNEMMCISNTEENSNFAEGKRDHSSDENNFASTFVKLEINSTHTPTSRKRGHEDEQNDSTIINKRAKLFENAAIQNRENYCSSSYDSNLLNQFHPFPPQNRKNYCNMNSSYNGIPLNHVPPLAPQNVHCQGTYNPIPLNQAPHFDSPNLKNYCNGSYNSMPLNHVSPFAPQNGQTYCNRNGSYNTMWLNHAPPSTQDLEKNCNGSYNQIPFNHVPPFAPQNEQNYYNRISSYNALRLNNVSTSNSQNLEKLCKSSYNQIPVSHGPSSALKNLEKYCNSTFVSIPSNHVSAVANVTGNLYKPASIPPNVGADYYYKAVYNSFLVNYLQTVAEHSV